MRVIMYTNPVHETSQHLTSRLLSMPNIAGYVLIHNVAYKRDDQWHSSCLWIRCVGDKNAEQQVIGAYTGLNYISDVNLHKSHSCEMIHHPAETSERLRGFKIQLLPLPLASIV